MTDKDIEWLLQHGFKELENGTWICEKSFDHVIYHADISLSDTAYLCNVQMHVNRVVDGIKTCKATYLGYAKLGTNARCAFERANCMCLLNQMVANQMLANANNSISREFMLDEQ